MSPRLFLYTALLGLACQTTAPEGPVNIPTPRGPVVATVGTERITAGEVELVARATGLSPREALDRVITERLEEREARRTIIADADLRDVLWRARIQALLAREIEARWEPSAIATAELDAVFERRRAELTHGPTRSIVHFIARARPSFDAHAAAESFHARVLSTDGGRLTAESFAAAVGPHSEDTRIETLPPFDGSGLLPNGASLVPEFVHATDSLTESSPLSAPFETSFGWHVALLIATGPASTVTVSQARDIVRGELVAAHRAHATRALIDRLRARAHVQLSESSLEALRHIDREIP